MRVASRSLALYFLASISNKQTIQVVYIFCMFACFCLLLAHLKNYYFNIVYMYLIPCIV